MVGCLRYQKRGGNEERPLVPLAERVPVEPHHQSGPVLEGAVSNSHRKTEITTTVHHCKD